MSAENQTIQLDPEKSHLQQPAPEVRMPISVLARLIAMLPPLDLAWPAAAQGQWWAWFEDLAAKARPYAE